MPNRYKPLMNQVIKGKDNMVTFEDNEFEIAIATYNRRDFIKRWLELCYEDVLKRNISLSIYDSSSNSETEDFIREYNKNHKAIKYVKVTPETEIGYKPVLPILDSNAKYLWVSGDARYHDFNELDEKVFPLIKRGIDLIVFYWGYEEGDVEKIYSDKSSFLIDASVSLTGLGWAIYKMKMFDELKTDKACLQEYDAKYRHNYGFGWMGYTLEAFAKNGSTAAITKIQIKNVFPKKKSAWFPRFYECWVENLIDIADNLPETYTTKRDFPRDIWDKMKRDSHYYCRLARLGGGLDPEVFEKYYKSGMLQRLSDKIGRIKFYAYAPMWQVHVVSFIGRANVKMCRIIKKILKVK